MEELLRQLGLHVGGGFFGERDGENLARIELVVFDEAAVAFDEHGGLTRAGSGNHAGVELAVFDGVELGRGEISWHRRLRW